ncbi:adenosine 5'-monophosphoramidase HINT3-like [Daphnia pulicaria]|uniref:adenosine 5'-monophosphoramidase HINT3-like n=1 Tax=Daphnia pulicaria TaxID=35523 RepID=UPI001EEC0E9B|nr:adenosine 5'-monophosphoramidase HINT3-like [Daphnia pulicaria]
MVSVQKSIKCIFCQICEGLAPATIVHQDLKYLAFNDIKPSAKNHLLVIPRDHINDIKSLTIETVSMVEEMVAVGQQLVKNHGGDLSDCRMGFHWPPFNSIKHLHLHVIFPESAMSFIGRQVFRPGTFYFATPEVAIEWIKKHSASL